MKTLFLLLIFLSTTTSVFCQAGIVDTFSFGVNGAAITSLGDNQGTVTSMVLQPDGKILLGGYTVNYPGYSVAVVRYTTNGLLDQSFGNGGIVIANLQSDQYVYSRSSSMLLQSDGKILLVGTSFSSSSPFYFAAMRLKDDGTFDSSFAANGIYLRDANFENVIPNSVVLQPDGKFITGGTTSGLQHISLSRHNEDGSIDSSFGSNGTTVTTTNTYNSEAINSLALQSDGKIIAFGTTSFGSSNFVFARYTSNGVLDSSFADSGLVVATGGMGNSMFIQSDGKIVGGGSSIGGFGITRFNENGTIDNSFGANGVVNTLFQGDAYLQSLVQQENGKIIAGGYSWNGNNYAFTLVRYLQSGGIDSSFGTNGITVTNLEDGSSIAIVALQQDEKILAAGNVYNFNENKENFALVRYLNDANVGIGEVGSPNSSDAPEVSPNPFSESFELKNPTSEKATLKVFDVEGNLLQQQQLNAGEEISMGENFPSGIYLLQLQTAKQTSSVKVVKTN